MNFYSQKSYKSLEAELIRSVRLGSNCAVVTIPGFGISYFLQKFLEKNKESGFSYITNSNQNLSKFNILDLDFDKNKDSLKTADAYFRKATLEQKFAVVINTPALLHSSIYESSFLTSHVYSTFYFKTRDLNDTGSFAREINKDLSDKEIEKIYNLTGGIASLVKYFAINNEEIGRDIDQLLENSSFLKIIIQTVNTISETNNKELTQLGLKVSDRFVSEILEKYFKMHTIVFKPQILINKDLSFEENGRLSKEKLTKIESQVLEYILENKIIEREKISEYKWGEGKYDKFSDQAINKTIQRINDKLQNYRFVSISKLGYKLEVK